MKGERRAGGWSIFKRVVVWSFLAQVVLIAVVLTTAVNGPAPEEGLLGIALRAYWWTFWLALLIADSSGITGEAVIGLVLITTPILALIAGLGYSLALAWIWARLAKLSVARAAGT